MAYCENSKWQLHCLVGNWRSSWQVFQWGPRWTISSGLGPLESILVSDNSHDSRTGRKWPLLRSSATWACPSPSHPLDILGSNLLWCTAAGMALTRPSKRTCHVGKLKRWRQCCEWSNSLKIALSWISMHLYLLVWSQFWWIFMVEPSTP